MKVSDTNYTLVIVAEDGTQYDVSDFAEDLGWEENEKELATTMSFSVGTENEQLGEIIKIGCLAAVLTNGVERVRATINKSKSKTSGSKVTNQLTAYDDLFPLQKSEDHLYFAAGQTTQAILTQIFSEWGIPLGTYSGANVTHEKLVYRSGTLADNILDILDDAVKKGGPKSIIRATEGVIEVIQRGANETIYQFAEDSAISAEQEISITDLVTRVKVIGKETTEGRPAVEAVLNGLTQFGIRQKIYARENDANATEAQTAAQKILDEKGNVSKKQSIQAPDCPEIRKGDVVYVNIGAMDGYYFATGVRHDAASGTITIDLEERVEETVQEQKTEEKKEYKTGDIVNFHGGTHYVSSYAEAKGYSARAGQAKITMDPTCKNNGGAHPWHLIHTDATSNVYGWVDTGTFD